MSTDITPPPTTIDANSMGSIAEAFQKSIDANIKAQLMKADYDAAMAFAQLRTK